MPARKPSSRPADRARRAAAPTPAAPPAESTDLRIDPRRDEPPRSAGRYVLYWMTMFRRPGWNFALERAAHWARELDRPLLVLEPLRAGYPWASDRLHRFVLEGMEDNARAFAGTRATYRAYVEPEAGAGKGLLEALARHACVVVGDDYPGFFLPRMLAAATRRIPCRFEAVDSNGLLPLRAAPKAFGRAVDFRRFLQKSLPPWLERLPAADPLSDLPAAVPAIPREVDKRWPAATGDLVARIPTLPIDHSVPAGKMRGGATAARARLDAFLAQRLDRYPEDRGEPALDGTSALSPYLHFGHLSVHEAFARIVARERWTAARLGKPNAKREGWWGMSAPAEAWLDELVTWRELCFNTCAHQPGYERYESAPAWARASLEKHAQDARPHAYSPRELDAADTHDPVWNAAHRQLRRDGWFHNRMRMLWAKKILEWSRRPQDALPAMAALMNRYSLDGRGPNAWGGYLWTFGRYDRPWGPERPIFGLVRWLSSENTARKTKLRDYLARYGG